MQTWNREELIEKLLENMGAVKRSMYSHMQLPKTCPISRPQLELLYAIKHLQPISFKELARHLNFTPGFISQIAEGVEAQGFIERETQLIDRRVHLLKITKKGLKLLGTIERSRQAHMKTIMEDLTNRELATWLAVQEKILARAQLTTQLETENQKG